MEEEIIKRFFELVTTRRKKERKRPICREGGQFETATQTHSMLKMVLHFL
jgi:hypothetical protein